MGICHSLFVTKMMGEGVWYVYFTISTTPMYRKKRVRHERKKGKKILTFHATIRYGATY